MTSFLPNDKENIVAALSSKHINHICIIRLDVTGSQLESIAKVMQEPLPVLKCLQINLDDVNAPELPAKFLGGSAPNLWEVSLYNILYLSLPAFLLSAIDLIKLNLHKVPPNGYISPKAVVVGLAALLKLEIFILGFLYPWIPISLDSYPILIKYHYPLQHPVIYKTFLLSPTLNSTALASI